MKINNLLATGAILAGLTIGLYADPPKYKSVTYYKAAGDREGDFYPIYNECIAYYHTTDPSIPDILESADEVDDADPTYPYRCKRFMVWNDYNKNGVMFDHPKDVYMHLAGTKEPQKFTISKLSLPQNIQRPKLIPDLDLEKGRKYGMFYVLGMDTVCSDISYESDKFSIKPTDNFPGREAQAGFSNEYKEAKSSILKDAYKKK